MNNRCEFRLRKFRVTPKSQQAKFNNYPKARGHVLSICGTMQRIE
jgi:hypothetical protein